MGTWILIFVLYGQPKVSELLTQEECAAELMRYKAGTAICIHKDIPLLQMRRTDKERVM